MKPSERTEKTLIFTRERTNLRPLALPWTGDHQWWPPKVLLQPNMTRRLSHVWGTWCICSDTMRNAGHVSMVTASHNMPQESTRHLPCYAERHHHITSAVGALPMQLAADVLRCFTCLCVSLLSQVFEQRSVQNRPASQMLSALGRGHGRTKPPRKSSLIRRISSTTNPRIAKAAQNGPLTCRWVCDPFLQRNSKGECLHKDPPCKWLGTLGPNKDAPWVAHVWIHVAEVLPSISSKSSYACGPLPRPWLCCSHLAAFGTSTASQGLRWIKNLFVQKEGSLHGLHHHQQGQHAQRFTKTGRVSILPSSKSFPTKKPWSDPSHDHPPPPPTSQLLLGEISVVDVWSTLCRWPPKYSTCLSRPPGLVALERLPSTSGYAQK